MTHPCRVAPYYHSDADANIARYDDMSGKLIAIRSQSRTKSVSGGDALFRSVFKNAAAGIAVMDMDSRCLHVNQRFCDMLGYSMEHLLTRKLVDLTHPEDVAHGQEAIKKHITGETAFHRLEKRFIRKDGAVIWVDVSINPIIGPNGEVKAMAAIFADITSKKDAEAALTAQRAELAEINRELARQAAKLEDRNAALRVLIEQREYDLSELENRLMHNIRNAILPFIQKAEQAGVSRAQKPYLEAARSNLENLLASLGANLSAQYGILTPREIQVANLIAADHSSKEIAEVLSLSPATVEFHRRNIRKKLGVRNKKINLRSHLYSLKN